jgi:hypothetical protein
VSVSVSVCYKRACARVCELSESVCVCVCACYQGAFARVCVGERESEYVRVCVCVLQGSKQALIKLPIHAPEILENQRLSIHLIHRVSMDATF